MPLQLKRVRITAGNVVAFDERFHQGINLIEGENSSGKSTLFKIIYHGLGGAITPAQWTEAALRCDRVLVEVALGETVLTMARKIGERAASAPVLILAGTIDHALDGASIDDWQEYPYSRSDNKQSISQLLFSLLRWPEAFSDQGDFLTFNQFLRAHYADQDSPNTTVLRYEDQFDKPTTRESIGNFLLGGNDQKLAQKERALRESEAEYSRASGAASAGVQLMGGEFDELNLPALAETQLRYASELGELEEASSTLMQQALRPIGRADVDVERLGQVTDSISKIKRQIAATSEKVSQTQFEIEDSDLFLSTLSSRVQYLTEASSAATDFGPISLDFCPACGTTVPMSDDHAHCYLCKTEFGDEPAEKRFFSMINSAQSQIEQSKRLQKNRWADLQKSQHELATLSRSLDAAAVELEQQQASVVSSTQAKLAETQSRIGFIRSELERLRRDHSIIERLQKLRERRDQLNNLINALREEIEALRSNSNTRVANAFARVSSETLEFLRADVERQEGFRDSQSVEVDYRANRFRLSGANSLSASSTAYMRNSIFLGEMFAACSMPSMRHLRMVMLENLEDKGMEPSRYHHFHRTIVDRSQTLSGEWQIFIATADWAPRLTTGVTRIGRRYTHERKTLDLPATL
ncbi:ATP-binding protein [soil metagenome]